MVLLIRDPRDVIVSSYYERKYRGATWGYEYKGEGISTFLREERGSFLTLLAFLKSLAGLRSKMNLSNVLVLYYEDLIACPSMHLETLAHFLHANADDCLDAPVLQEASKRCSFSQMQREAESSGLPSLAPAGPSVSSRKVRSGRVGSYRTELSPQDVRYLRRLMSEHLAGLGLFESYL